MPTLLAVPPHNARKIQPLTVYILGNTTETPLQFQFTKKLNIYAVQGVLAGHVMG